MPHYAPADHSVSLVSSLLYTNCARSLSVHHRQAACLHRSSHGVRCPGATHSFPRSPPPPQLRTHTLRGGGLPPDLFRPLRSCYNCCGEEGGRLATPPHFAPTARHSSPSWSLLRVSDAVVSHAGGLRMLARCSRRNPAPPPPLLGTARRWSAMSSPAP